MCNLYKMCMLTLKADVSQVQYGCQQLEDFLTLFFREGQDFHGRTDTNVVFGIIPAFTHDTVTLSHIGGKV